MEPRSRDDEWPVERSTDEAREGVTGHNARYVLLFGLVGAIVALAVIYGLFFAP